MHKFLILLVKNEANAEIETEPLAAEIKTRKILIV